MQRDCEKDNMENVLESGRMKRWEGGGRIILIRIVGKCTVNVGVGWNWSR